MGPRIHMMRNPWWAGVIAGALGCSAAPGGSVTVAVPVATTPAAVTAAPAARESFSFGEQKVLWHGDLPVIELPCDRTGSVGTPSPSGGRSVGTPSPSGGRTRVAWTNINGEVWTYRFGDASPNRLPDTPGFGALAWSGEELYAAVESSLRWNIVVHRGGAWEEVERGFTMPSRNIGADAQHVVWVARSGEGDSLFVLDRRSGHVTPRQLGRAHSSVRRLIVDHGHAFVLAEDSMLAPRLYDAELDDSSVRALADVGELLDFGVANGVRVGLQHTAERGMADVVTGAPWRSVGRVATVFHPSVAVGGGLACYFSSDDDRAATVGCVDLASSRTRVVDRFESNWELLAICGDERLVWTRPAKPKGWDLVQADLLR